MQQTFRGHLAVLADAFTYSDGETFAAGVKALKLGPVIGTRTSGAGIWLSDRNRLADNGIARVAEFGQFDLDGLLRAAPEQRADAYTKALNAETGWMRRSEVRELEDLPPENGDPQ